MACAAGSRRRPISRVRLQRFIPLCASFTITTRERLNPIPSSSSGVRSSIPWP
jgi:hypothetical protein